MDKTKPKIESLTTNQLKCFLALCEMANEKGEVHFPSEKIPEEEIEKYVNANLLNTPRNVLINLIKKYVRD